MYYIRKVTQSSSRVDFVSDYELEEDEGFQTVIDITVDLALNVGMVDYNERDDSRDPISISDHQES